MDHEPSLPTFSAPRSLRSIINLRNISLLLIGGVIGGGIVDGCHRTKSDPDKQEWMQREFLALRTKKIEKRTEDVRQLMNDLADGKMNHLVPALRVRLLLDWITALEADREENDDILKNNPALAQKMDRVIGELRQAVTIMLPRMRQQIEQLPQERKQF